MTGHIHFHHTLLQLVQKHIVKQSIIRKSALQILMRWKHIILNHLQCLSLNQISHSTTLYLTKFSNSKLSKQLQRCGTATHALYMTVKHNLNVLWIGQLLPEFAKWSNFTPNVHITASVSISSQSTFSAIYIWTIRNVNPHLQNASDTESKWFSSPDRDWWGAALFDYFCQ